MSIKSFDQNNLVQLLDPPALQVGTNSSWVQPFAGGAGANRAVFMVITGALASNAVTVELWQATDSNGADAKKVEDTLVTIASTSTGEIITIEIGPGALDNSTDAVEGGNSAFTWVQARVTSAAQNLWTLLYFKHNLRYPGYFDQDATYSQAVRVYD